MLGKYTKANMAKKKKAAKKADKKYPNHTNELTYFLDHPDIKREECEGNGSTPGPMNVPPSTVRSGTMQGSTAQTGKPSIAAQIGFGGIKK